jgi:quercetin dioxygenase-like cupin family protein
MKKYKLDQFTRGWVVGDFEPNIIRSKDFEVMVQYYKKGDVESRHVHKIADEITIIVSGEFKMNGEILKAGDIVHLLPGDATDFECLLDGATTVIKTPSVIGDKFIIN